MLVYAYIYSYIYVCMYICVCVYIYRYIYMNDSNDTRDRRKELILFCYYKVLILPRNGNSVI